MTRKFIKIERNSSFGERTTHHKCADCGEFCPIFVDLCINCDREEYSRSSDKKLEHQMKLIKEKNSV
jgi:hypothetical protein